MRAVIAALCLIFGVNGTQSVERHDVDLYWDCEEAEILRFPRVNHDLKEVRGVVCAWTSGCGEVAVYPFFSVRGTPAPLRLKVIRFKITNEALLDRLEGEGYAEYTAFRSSFGCSGARIHLRYVY
jgi:hypothetical protein